MRLRTINTAALALCAALTLPAPPSMATQDGRMRAAFFSDLCQQQAASLGVAHTSDANALLAAFETYLVGAPLRSPVTPAGADCMASGILLINLLRLNGLDAELVLASKQSAGETGDAQRGEVLRVLVYIVALKKYVDPDLPRSEQVDLDRVVREAMHRVHFRRPLIADGARDACFDACMDVYMPRTGMSPVPVKTQMIRRR
jgi:hypothetical protein